MVLKGQPDSLQSSRALPTSSSPRRWPTHSSTPPQAGSRSASIPRPGSWSSRSMTTARFRARAGQAVRSAGLEDRIEALGGRVEIASAPGHGTQLRAHLPLDKADRA